MRQTGHYNSDEAHVSSWLEQYTEEIVKNWPAPVLRPSVAYGLHHIQHVIELVERAIEQHKSDVREEGLEALRAATANPFHSFIEQPAFAPMAMSAEMTFPMILRNSLFIAIASHFEHVLRRWCKLVASEWSLPAFPRKPKNRNLPVLHHCLCYLRDVAGLQLGALAESQEWQRLDAARLVRNALIHDGGVLDEDDDGVKAKIVTLPGIELEDSQLVMEETWVHLLPGACEAAAENAKVVLEVLERVRDADPRA